MPSTQWHTAGIQRKPLCAWATPRLAGLGSFEDTVL